MAPGIVLTDFRTSCSEFTISIELLCVASRSLICSPDMLLSFCNASCMSGAEAPRSTRTTCLPSGHLELLNLRILVRSAAVNEEVLLALSTTTANCVASHAEHISMAARNVKIRRLLCMGTHLLC